MPSVPIPPEVSAYLAEPHLAVVASLRPDGERRVACRFEPSLRASRPYVYVPIEYSPARNCDR